MEASELVRKAMARLGIAESEKDAAAQFARALGLTEYGSPRRVKRWLAGTSEPEYEATLLLLSSAGLLHEEAVPLGPADEGAALTARAEDALAQIVEAARGLQRTGEDLAQIAAELRRPRAVDERP